MKRISLLLCALCLSPKLAGAALISSTVAGGFWAVGSTWVGGIIPGLGDDVIIAGQVHVTGTQSCASLLVLPAGQLNSANSPGTLRVSGAIENQGLIRDNFSPYTSLYVELGGDLTNAGSWINRETRITGGAERRLRQEPAAEFSSALVFAPGAAGDLVVATPFTKTADLDVTGGRLIAEPACPLTVIDGRISGELRMGGNPLHAEGYTYLQNASLDAAVLYGDVDIAGVAHFTGGLRVMDSMLPSAVTGGGQVTIAGGLVNEGTIANTTYGLGIDLAGNLENNGLISNSSIQLDGASVHHLSMGPSGLYDVSMFLPEFQGGEVVADTPLTLRDGLGLSGGSLTLVPGADLTFIGWGSLTSGTVYANGNTLDMHGYGFLSDLTVDQAILSGRVQIEYAAAFTGGLTVTDTLQARETGGGSSTVTVAGLMVSEQLVQDSPQQLLHLHVRNDLQNYGAMTNSRLVVDGSVAQAIGAGPGIAVPAVVLESGLVADSYQWFRNGEPLPGETATQLTLAGVGAADYGVYQCAAEGGTLLSRTIAIAEFADPTATPPLPAPARLAQNHPNPFNPATEIAFNLAAAGPARLAVYDLAGREVALLVDGPLAAGEHRVRWRPEGLASGIYLYRLAAGGVEQVGKCTLLK